MISQDNFIARAGKEQIRAALNVSKRKGDLP
jgi:hypothetical protein